MVIAEPQIQPRLDPRAAVLEADVAVDRDRGAGDVAVDPDPAAPVTAIDAQIDCVVHLLLNSGAVTNVQLVHYTLNAREPTAGMPQVVVSPVVLRETLDLAWRFRDGTGEVPLLFQAAGSGLPGPSEGRTLVEHFARLMEGWRPPYFGGPAERISYCNLGNPCAPVWETTF